MNEEDGVAAQLFLTLKKKNKKGKFYYPEDVALAILRSMNRLATVAALQKLQKQRRELERESQMLELLMEPLNQITAGLERTTESAQRLRAVLYDPQQSIFNAASRVWRYFEEGSQVKIAGEQVVVAHNFNNYNEAKRWAKKAFFGPSGNPFGDIWLRSPKYNQLRLNFGLRFTPTLKAATQPLKNSRNTCKNIIEASSSGSGSSVSSSEVFNVLQKLVDGREESDLEHLGEVWDRFKKLLHEPYKFHPNSFSIMPLALIVLVQSKSITVNEKEYKELPEFLASENREDSVFKGSDLPFPRAAVLWTLVQHLQQKQPLKSATVKDQKNKTYIY